MICGNFWPKSVLNFWEGFWLGIYNSDLPPVKARGRMLREKEACGSSVNSWIIIWIWSGLCTIVAMPQDFIVCAFSVMPELSVLHEYDFRISAHVCMNLRTVTISWVFCILMWRLWVPWGVGPGLCAVGPTLQCRVNQQSQGSGIFPTWALVLVLCQTYQLSLAYL